MKKSNEPTKTKKAMKTIKFLSMAALALVGAVMTGCSSDDDNIIETPQQPENTSKVVTLTTTVGLDGGGSTTRALTSGGVKTFAVGDVMAAIYYKGGTMQKAESKPLASTDITEGGKKATFTFELDTPNKSNPVMYIYPASMANNDGSSKLDRLASQDGTLESLARNLDLAVYTGNWVGDNLPTGTLANQLAVCALTLKDNATPTPNTITRGLTEVTVSDGSNTYTVTPTSSTFGEDVIYVAIRPVTAALQYTATDGTKNYTKTATSREYEPGNFYNLGLRMVELVPATGHALSASVVGEIVCSDGLAYAAADKDNLPTGVTAVAIVAYVGDAGSVDASSSTYKGLAIAMSNANGGSGCTWGDWGATYHCVSESNDIATAIGYKDGISSTNTLTSDGHTHNAATAAASNNGTAAPTGTSGWFLPSIGQWNLIVQGLAYKAGSAVTTDITKWDENDTYKASNLNSVITDAGGTGFNGDYQSSTQYDGEECWHMCISSGRAWSYGFSAGDYVRSVLAF